MGCKVDTKSKLIRQLGDTVDLSSFDFQTGRNIPNTQQSLLQQQSAIRSTNMQRSIIEMLPSSVPSIKHPLSIEYRCLDCFTLRCFILYFCSLFRWSFVNTFQFAFMFNIIGQFSLSFASKDLHASHNFFFLFYFPFFFFCFVVICPLPK